jgi:anti-anti-sigma regulatory factor
MLRITTHHQPEQMTFQLEGRLAGPWVQALQECYRATLAAHHPAAVEFDLTAVTFVDAAGKEFLAAVHADGGRFLTTCCLMRALVAGLARPQKTAETTHA